MFVISVIFNVIFNTNNLSGLQKKTAVFTGVCLLVLANLLFIGSLLEVFDLESFALAGHSGLRALAGIAVAGCVLAAVGCWDE
jgi:hypothetical protein